MRCTCTGCVGAGRVLAERTERLPGPAPGRWPLAPLARAALDFARRSSERDEVGAGDGVRSVAEADARRLAARSGLPQPLYNPRLLDKHGRSIAVPDVWFDEVGPAWEIDSHEYHLSPQDYDRTLDRRSAMMAECVLVMHSQPAKRRRRRNEVVDELRRTYAQAARRPRPDVVAVPAE